MSTPISLYEAHLKDFLQGPFPPIAFPEHFSTPQQKEIFARAMLFKLALVELEWEDKFKDYRARYDKEAFFRWMEDYPAFQQLDDLSLDFIEARCSSFLSSQKRGSV